MMVLHIQMYTVSVGWMCGIHTTGIRFKTTKNIIGNSDLTSWPVHIICLSLHGIYVQHGIEPFLNNIYIPYAYC